MKYPFEKIANSDFVNPQDKEKFSELRTHVKDLNEEGVEQWFLDNNSYLKVKGKENLAKAIGNTTYYFSVQSNGLMSKENIISIELFQYEILLKHFNLEQQFRILTQVYDFKDERLFELLYQTAKKEKKQEKRKEQNEKYKQKKDCRKKRKWKEEKEYEKEEKKIKE